MRMVLNLRTTTTLLLFVLFITVSYSSEDEPKFFRMKNGYWYEIETRSVPENKQLVYIAQQVYGSETTNDYKLIEMAGEKNSTFYKPGRIYLNGKVCLFSFSAEGYNGNASLNCNYSPRGEWLALSWNQFMYQTTKQVSSYQVWDMMDCPLNQFKRNNNCENITSEPCGYTNTTNIGDNHVVFMNELTCSVKDNYSMRKSYKYPYSNNLLFRKKNSAQLVETNHTGFYLAGQTCFATHKNVRWTSKAQIYCNFQTNPIYIRSKDVIKSYTVWSLKGHTPEEIIECKSFITALETGNQTHIRYLYSKNPSVPDRDKPGQSRSQLCDFQGQSQVASILLRSRKVTVAVTSVAVVTTE